MTKLNPVIRTRRLRIDPFSKKYLTEGYVSWLNDPEVVHFSEQRHRVHTLKSCREYWDSYNATPNLFWAIVTRVEPFLHIGNITATVDLHNQLADVGILIGEKKIWGQGYGLEAWIGVCEYLVSAGLRKITAGTLASNKAMLKVMQRSAMVEDGRRIRQVILGDGSEVDMIYNAIFADDWSPPPGFLPE